MRYRTVDQIMAAGPCKTYPRARVERLFDGRSRLSNHAVAKLDIPAPDRVWALLVYMTPQEQRLFACDCAERALLLERKDGREPDKRSWRAIEVSRQYALGNATAEELNAARGATFDIIDTAMADMGAIAARDATGAIRASYWAAASDAGSSAWDTAWYAAWVVDRGDDNATERSWQIAHALEIMDNTGGKA
jgi:hypothetical protein